ncbi:hypothetical protein BH09SUM1_BH09SUM1_04500 [soil metagenome]
MDQERAHAARHDPGRRLIAPPMMRYKQPIIFVLFVALWLSNIMLSNHYGSDVLRLAREIPRDSKAPLTEEQRLRISHSSILLFTNMPLFLAVGPMAKAPIPKPTAFYWVAVTLGSTYIPFFLTLLTYLTVTAPSSRMLPGMRRNDTAATEEDDDDEY